MRWGFMGITGLATGRHNIFMSSKYEVSSTGSAINLRTLFQNSLASTIYIQIAQYSDMLRKIG